MTESGVRAVAASPRHRSALGSAYSALAARGRNLERAEDGAELLDLASRTGCRARPAAAFSTTSMTRATAIPNERPFPFLPTMDPAEYVARDLVGLDVPAIVYRAVSKHTEDGL